jgi:lysophospholipase L1-like esterase
MRKSIFLATTVLVCAVGFVAADYALAWRAQRDLLLRYGTMSGEPRCRSMTLYGDSIIAGFPARTFLPNAQGIRNEGIGGNSTEQIANRLAADASGSEVLVIQGGINDIIGADARQEPVVDRIRSAYAASIAHAKKAGQSVVLVSVHPVTGRYLLPYMNGFNVENVNRLVRETNQALRELATAEQVAFADIHAALAGGDGEARREFVTPDGYHLNVRGYEVLARSLSDLLCSVSRKPSVESRFGSSG